MPLALARRKAGERGAVRGRTVRRRRLAFELALALLGAAAVAWAFGLVAFVRAIPESVEDADTPTDAIVVLTGGAERLATGLKLLAAGKADAVFVSGVNPNVGVRQVVQAAGGGADLERLAPRIEAGHGARDTAGNAAETAAWMRQRGWRSLRLVTASYHMPRSRFEFANALPEVKIIAHPVFPLPPSKGGWWRHPDVVLLIVGEYHKLILSWLRHASCRGLAAVGG